MKFSLNPNFIKSSNLIFISAGLGLINFLLSPDILSSKKNIIISIITIVIILVVGLLIRLEITWIKYLLLILIILGLNSLPMLLKDEFSTHPLNALITILQSIAQIYATILLFKSKTN
ncbi:hypothetical protein [Flavobacterium sp. 3-210]